MDLFDKEVQEYNTYLQNAQKPKKTIHAFLEGIGSIMNLSGVEQKRNSEKKNQTLYEREDLTGYQKDVIAIASDIQRIQNDLEKIVSGEKEDDVFTQESAQVCMQILNKTYESYKQKFNRSKSLDCYSEPTSSFD